MTPTNSTPPWGTRVPNGGHFEKYILRLVAALTALAIPALIVLWADVRVIQSNRFTAANGVDLERRHGERDEALRTQLRAEIEILRDELREHLRIQHGRGP